MKCKEYRYDNVVQIPLMDIAGRRLLLIIPMIVMIVDLIAMTVSLALQVTLTHATTGEIIDIHTILYVFM